MQDEEAEVKLNGKDANIPAGKIVQITCKTNVGLIEKEREMIFQQKDIELPKDIEILIFTN